MSTFGEIKLTRLTEKGGCAAKWGLGDLADILANITGDGIANDMDKRLLQGYGNKDGVAVYRLREDLAAVVAVDFLTPVVDNPYIFGRIAAANALSAIYATGAKPLLALNLLALDNALDKSCGRELSAAILRGGADVVREAAALVAGVQIIEDKEPKYGLAVLGLVHPERVLCKSGAQSGDLLYLTKALGTGIMTSAFRASLENEDSMTEVIASMCALNASTCRAMRSVEVHAVTDVGGFGLAGHLNEMLVATDQAAVIDWEAMPIFPRVLDYVRTKRRPGKSYDTEALARTYVECGNLGVEEYDERMAVLCDPQTSGGLLIAIPPEEGKYFDRAFLDQEGHLATCIGRIVDGHPGKIRFE